MTLPSGTVGLVRQEARGFVDGTCKIHLREYFGFIDPDDEVPLGDNYRLEGIDQSYTSRCAGRMVIYHNTGGDDEPNWSADNGRTWLAVRQRLRGLGARVQGLTPTRRLTGELRTVAVCHRDDVVCLKSEP